ncbi:SPOSA6832_04553, partial [Sporobolomyces salmonicolor]
MDAPHSNNRRMLQHHRRRAAAATTAVVGDAQPNAASTSTTRARATSTTASEKRRPSFLTATNTASSTTAATATTATSDSSSSSSVALSSATAHVKGVTTTGTTAANLASASISSPGSASAAPATSNKSSSHGGAIAGAIVAVVAVLAILAGFFLWRRKKAARAARGSGTGLMGGGAAAGAGGYKKQQEGDDEMFGSSSRDNSSLFGTSGEKTFSTGSGVAPQGSYGATTSWNQPQPQAQNHGWNASEPQSMPAVAPTQPSYPPTNGPLPASTANLLASSPPSMSNHDLPASLAIGVGAGVSSPRASAALASATFDDALHQSIEQRELQQEMENRRMSMMTKTQTQPVEPVVAAAASPFGESEGQGEIRTVKGTFDPSLDDELVLYPGDCVQVLMKYDDGWALGLNLSTGNPPAKGVFPFDCLGDLCPPPTASQIRSRPPSTARALSPVPATANPASISNPASPVNPANIPLPPPTPTLQLASIAEDDDSAAFATSPSMTMAGPPQLAPLERSDSPLSANFPPSALAPPQIALHGEQQQQYGVSVSETQKLKRHSSLIASRDADLFVALGEVLDKEGAAGKA